MERVKNFFQVIEDIYQRDNRYKPDSYEFVMQALNFTQKKLAEHSHVTGQELLGGIRQFALEQYGPMAKTVLNHWGITKTEDFGNIVFNMIEKEILSKTKTDSIEDFKDVFDFQSAFKHI
jgi:uncharacterized repeat protein (TIGR04138 family)